MKNLKIIALIFSIIFVINILSIISDALIDCSNCHTTEPGKSAIKAKDTIVINDTTCLKCHNPNYPPTPIGYNTHLAHVGKFSAKVNFLVRHPTVSNLQCGDCHKQIFDCTNCHVNGIPHVPPPLGLNCQGCHNQIDNLFRHPTTNLTIHNIFHLNSTKDCQMCHNPDSMKSLKLASGDTIPIDQAYNLCKQCHSSIYNLWDSGQHYANKSAPLEIISGEDPSAKADYENNWQNRNSCVNCHNPHNPNELYQLPLTTKDKEDKNLYSYAIPIVVIIMIMMVGIIVVKYPRDVIMSRLGLTNLISKLSSLSLPKMPKISLPVSITIDDGINDDGYVSVDGILRDGKGNIKIDKVKDIESIQSQPTVSDGKIEKVKDIESIQSQPPTVGDDLFKDLDKKLENLIENSPTDNKLDKLSKLKKYKKYKGDILFISGVIAMFVMFYAIFGTWTPMAVAISESMSPHIEKGDLIFFTDSSRMENIQTFDNRNYKSFDDYGDVIIYKPFGQDTTPIIHRAMYFVNKSQPMWMGGPPAPDNGYITKGDNNPDYDQKSSVSNLQPVKKEWIRGVARFRIPYIGYIRLWL